MKASTHLAVRVEGNVAVFTMPHYPGWMMLIGTSCTSGAEPHTICQSIAVTVPQNEKAVVIIKTTYDRSKEKIRGFDNIMCIIPITWENGKMVVDLERPFVPSSDRLLQVNDSCTEATGVVVSTAGQRFICSKVEKGKLTEKGYRIVEDSTVLLRFALGQATLEDLEAAATLDKRSQIERELEQMKARLENVEVTLSQEREYSTKLAHDLELEEQKSGDLFKDLNNAMVTIGECRSLAAAMQSTMLNARYRNADNSSWFGFLPWVKVRKLKLILSMMLKENGK